MPRVPSAKRYAQAAFQIALEANDLDGWREDLAQVEGSLQDEALVSLLSAPEVPVADKLRAISTLLPNIRPLVVNLVGLLASRGTIRMLPIINQQYQRFLDVHPGIQPAEVVSAVPLDDDQQRRVSELLVTMAGTEVRLSTRVDPNLVGGIIARVGDRVIDGTTRTRLQELRKNLSSATI